MKKVFPIRIMIPVLALSFFVVSCNAPASEVISPQAQKNLNTVHAITETFKTKDFSKLGDYIAEDAVDHSGENGDVKGLDSIRAQFQMWLASADDHVEIIKELADDNYVMSWGHSTGKFLTNGMGHKAGDTYDVQMMDIAKLKDGKVIEHWSMMPVSDAMKMMASTTAQPTTTQPAMPADTVKRKK